jgi:GT2 family glycosyltransferase
MDLSVIIISYNTKEITEKCLSLVNESKRFCEKKLGNKIEVIVVDNASTDESPVMIKKKFPWVSLIQSGENLGFGKGNNLGMAHAKHPYLLLLNTDCFVKEKTFYDALKFFETYGSCDVLGSKLTFKNGSFQPSAGFVPNPVNTTFWMLGLDNMPGLRYLVDTVHERDRAFFKKTKIVDWVQGAFFMLKKEVFDQTQGFDENLFMYMEEVEWCMRIKKKKFHVYFTPLFEVVHLGGASSGYNLSVPLFKEMEGLMYVFQKHYKSWVGFLKGIISIGCLLRIIAFSILGKFNRVNAYLKVMKLIW